jgi:GAF domain-containing protein
VSQAVNSTLGLETVLSTIVAKAVPLSGTDAGAIYVFDDRQRQFHLRATYGMDQELIEALTHQRIGLDDSRSCRRAALRPSGLALTTLASATLLRYGVCRGPFRRKANAALPSPAV